MFEEKHVSSTYIYSILFMYSIEYIQNEDGSIDFRSIFCAHI